jgi:UDP-glucose 4-epimerase
MRVLVTGGLGVNGSWVTRKLLERGHQPIVLESRADYRLLPELRDSFPVETGDVTDIASILRAITAHHAQRIVHMAALMPQAAQSDPLHGFAVNAAGTVNVLEAARIAGADRVVFTSSKAAYGEIPPGEHGHPRYRPVSEEHRCDPVLVYDVCKVAAEGIGRNYAWDHGIDFAALRFGTIYGPGKLARHGNVSILSRLIENAVAGVPTRIKRGGEQADDMVYVDDVADAVVLAVLAEDLAHSVYNVGSGRATTLHEFADAVRAVIPSAKIEIGDGLDFFDMGVNYYSVFDIDRARCDLGYQPRFKPLEGIRHYIDVMQRWGLSSQQSPEWK